MIGHPPDNPHLLSLWVTRRFSDHPLALPLRLRITLKSLHSNGCIHQSIKSLVSPSVQLLLQDAREATVEMVLLLLLIIVYMGPIILCKMVQLIHIIHHNHTPLLQIQKLSQLPVQQTNGNIVLTESSGKLLPSHMVVRRLHGIESIPPCTGRP